jgi:hypothetical protein
MCVFAVRTEFKLFNFLLVKKDVRVKGDVSVMTYRGHSLLRCLSRAYFSPFETTGQVGNVLVLLVDNWICDFYTAFSYIHFIRTFRLFFFPAIYLHW